jgi:methylthioribose-1-phosphate isomerase
VHVIEAVRWAPDGNAVRIIDQRQLPSRLVEKDLRTVEEIGEAIGTLAVRGAPAIGICAAMGLVAVMSESADLPIDAFRRRLSEAAARVRHARPTAVNLAWAVDRMLAVAAGDAPDAPALLARLRIAATAILDEDRAMCRRIGEFGITLLRDGVRVLTHCNAGALATGGIGTALAPVYLAAERGWRVQVFATETRPLLQGSRLTAWELSRAGIPVTVLADSAAGSLMARGLVDACIVGADRIAANGDVANKIGTYGLATLAHHHGIPFYVAVPTSTLDPDTLTGADIAIECRPEGELRSLAGQSIAPDDVPAYTPAFDVTPAALVTAIVTDQGVFRAPFHFRTVIPGPDRRPPP